MVWKGRLFGAWRSDAVEDGEITAVLQRKPPPAGTTPDPKPLVTLDQRDAIAVSIDDGGASCHRRAGRCHRPGSGVPRAPIWLRRSFAYVFEQALERRLRTRDPHTSGHDLHNDLLDLDHRVQHLAALTIGLSRSPRAW
jgi:hypothetical protein